MENKYLKRVQKKLNKYFCYFKHDNILVISEDKSVLPFAYVIMDSKYYPNYLLISYAVDCKGPDKAVEVALRTAEVLPVALTDNFFITQTGSTYIGPEAEKYHELEIDYPIKDIEPLSQIVH